MLKLLLPAILIVAISIAFLSIHLLCGKKRFVSPHIDENVALKKKGISCALQQDELQRRSDGLCIKEHQS